MRCVLLLLLLSIMGECVVLGSYSRVGGRGRREEGKWEGGKGGGDEIEGRRRFQMI